LIKNLARVFFFFISNKVDCRDNPNEIGSFFLNGWEGIDFRVFFVLFEGFVVEALVIVELSVELLTGCWMYSKRVLM
jgi:hypothetical protein